MPVRGLILDLDNTLYPADSGLEQEVNRRMTVWVADFLGRPREKAAELRRLALTQHGSTLQWLRAEFELAFNPDQFINDIYPKNIEAYLKPDPFLCELMACLPLPKVVLTNSPTEHARRVLDFLQLQPHITALHDIRSGGWVGKPKPAAYQKALALLGCEPDQVVMIEDSLAYLTPFIQMGGSGILVSAQAAEPVPDAVLVVGHIHSALKLLRWMLDRQAG